MKDSTHYLPLFRPLLALGEGHSLSEEPYLILYEFGFLHVVFLFLEKVLEEEGVDDEEEAFVQSVEDEESGLGV